MYLLFDTETTGLPDNWNAPVTDLSNWPRMVQIAWLLKDDFGMEEDRHDYIIKPDGFIIPDDVASVHGITTEQALQEGVPLATALEEFVKAVEQADILVAHNISFDEKIVGAELIRANMQRLLFEKPQVCTMKASTNFCKIPGRYGYKWPTLEELHWKLFKTPAKETHRAMADVDLCARCFFELKRLGVV